MLYQYFKEPFFIVVPFQLLLSKLQTLFQFAKLFLLNFQTFFCCLIFKQLFCLTIKRAFVSLFKVKYSFLIYQTFFVKFFKVVLTFQLFCLFKVTITLFILQAF